jgi:hypothetical protein
MCSGGLKNAGRRLLPIHLDDVCCIVRNRKHHLSVWLLERHRLVSETHVRQLDHRSTERNFEQRSSLRTYIGRTLLKARHDFAEEYQNRAIPPFLNLKERRMPGSPPIPPTQIICDTIGYTPGTFNLAGGILSSLGGS